MSEHCSGVAYRPLTEEQALDQREARVPVLCDCGQGDPPEHVVCSACGDDWDDCECGAADGSDTPWMLADLGGVSRGSR